MRRLFLSSVPQRRVSEDVATSFLSSFRRAIGRLATVVAKAKVYINSHTKSMFVHAVCQANTTKIYSTARCRDDER